MFGDGIESFMASRDNVETLREPIFYAGESAFNFQYRDFAVDIINPIRGLQSANLQILECHRYPRRLHRS